MSILNRMIVLLCLFLGFGSTYFVDRLVYEKWVAARQAEFIDASKLRINAVKQVLQNNIAALEALDAFNRASETITLEEFKQFSSPLLARNSTISSLIWATRKPDSDRRDASDPMHGWIVRQTSLKQQGATPSPLLNGPQMNRIERISHTNGLIIFPWQDDDDHSEVLVALPLSSDSTLTENSSSIDAFVAMRLNLSDLIDRALEPIPSAGIHITISQNDHVLGHHLSRRHNAETTHDFGHLPPLTYQEKLTFLDLSWDIIAEGINDIFYGETLYQRHIVALIGIFITLLITTIIIVMMFRQRYAIDMVATKTAELNLAHDTIVNYSKNLEQEVEKRTHELIEAKDRAEHANQLLQNTTRELLFQQNALNEHAIVSIANVKGDITYVNDKFVEISQYSREELLGQNHRFVKSDHHPDSFFKAMWRTIANGETWHGQIKNKAKDGTFYWTEATIVPFLNDQGKPERYVSIRTDITEHKNTAEALLVAKQQAEDASKAKSAFLSSMSHELRTPLNAILGFSQLLAGDSEHPLTSDQLESLAYITNSGQQLLNLVNDVLDLAQIDTGQFDAISIEPIVVSDVIHDVCRQVSSLAEQYHIVLNNTVADNSTMQIKADSQKLGQALFHIVSNAIKYNTEHGSVTLSTAMTENGKLSINITDMGEGIDEADFPALFEPFNRLNKANSTIEGTGIGLVISQHLVRLMGGEIGMYRNPDQGMTFWVAFEPA